MRFLGIDFGERRIGMAVSDPGGTIALGLDTIENSGIPAVIEKIRQVARDNDASCIVVGLPLNMDGSTGPRAEKVKAFAAELEQASGLVVEFWDERLSSVSAGRALEQGMKSRRKRRKHVDRVAAQIILQGFLDNRTHGENSTI